MKSILLLIMLTTMLFSNEKQIIVGSFIQENNALNSLITLNKHILDNKKLSTLINKNSIKVEIKKIGQYNAISLSPFTSYRQMLRTLVVLDSYYDDAYVLDHGHKITMIQVEAKKTIEVVEKVVVEKPAPIKVNSEIVKASIQEPLKDIGDETNYILEIILALLVLVAIIYTIFKKRKSIE